MIGASRIDQRLLLTPSNKRVRKIAPRYGAVNYPQFLWISLWILRAENFACFDKTQEKDGRLLIRHSAKVTRRVMHLD
jgi:hypothetical protein